MTNHISLLRWLPTELIIAIATLLDAPSLVCFESVRPFFLLPPFPYVDIRLILCQTCKALRNLVMHTPALKYVLALAARGLCDGPPSPVTAARRLELVEAYDKAWRTFSWSKHIVLELPYPHQAPYVSGDTLVLPIHGMKGDIRSFVMQSIPSPLRGVPGRQWQIDFDFFVDPFVIDATQDLLVVVPRHDNKKLVSSVSLPQVHPLTGLIVQCILVRALHRSTTPPFRQPRGPSYGTVPSPRSG